MRNKLDGGLYAIKHVKLNPKSVDLYKKITREVKLLSRLNHENVVRYYNAWIETIIEIDNDNDDSETVEVKKRSLEDDIAKLGQGIQVSNFFIIYYLFSLLEISYSLYTSFSYNVYAFCVFFSCVVHKKK